MSTAAKKSKTITDAAEGEQQDVEDTITITDVNRGFQTGDVRVISSDGLVFKCKMHQVSASEVLSDMLQSQRAEEGDATLRFTDERIEHGPIIATFLDSARGNMMARLLDKEAEDIFSFVLFLKKWECSACIEHLKALFRPMIENKDGLAAEEDYDDENWLDHIGFAVGAIIDDIDLCYANIRHGSRLVLKSSADALFDQHRDDTPSLDLRGAPGYYFELVPTEYVQAVLRAEIGRDLSSGSQDWKVIAKEFRRLMRADRKASSEK